MPGHSALWPSVLREFARDRSVDTKLNCAISRRAFVAGGGGLALAAFMPLWPAGHDAPSRHPIVAAEGRAPPVGGEYPETAVWSHNGPVPGPKIRVRQGRGPNVDVVEGTPAVGDRRSQ